MIHSVEDQSIHHKSFKFCQVYKRQGYLSISVSQ
nr:MAG TPA: hypothetical protein [Crassvirales sp.]